eukprot:2781537-Amphidinium_carterae.1
MALYSSGGRKGQTSPKFFEIQYHKPHAQKPFSHVSVRMLTFAQIKKSSQRKDSFRKAEFPK